MDQFTVERVTRRPQVIDSIYSSVPDEVIEQNTNTKYDPLREQLLLYLIEHKGELFTAKKLAETLGYPTKGTQVQLRKHVTELIEIAKQPILSTPRFGIAEYPNQMRMSIEKDEQRIKGLQRRINAKKEILQTMEEEFKRKNKL